MATDAKTDETLAAARTKLPSSDSPLCLTPDVVHGKQALGPMATGPSLRLGPNMPAKPRVLRLDLHVFTRDDGTGNYPDNANTRQIFADTVQMMNDNFLSNHRRSSLPAFTTFVPDLMLRARIANVFFHKDTAAYNLSQSPTNYLSPGVYLYNNFGTNKRKNLNIFIVAIPNAVGGGVVPGFTPYFFNWKGPDPAPLSAGWGKAQLWGHELCHNFGLLHSFGDLLSDTPPELVQGWIEPDSLKTSNNLTGYNNTHNFVTKMQAEKIHGDLRSTSSSMRDIFQAAPTPRGLISDTDTGMFSVEEGQDLTRVFWTSASSSGFPGRWNLETIANAAFKLVQGSLVATGPATCYGINDRYELVKTGLIPSAPPVRTLQALEIRSIGGPGITPGSLVDGLTPNTLFGVDLNRHWVKITAPAGWVTCNVTTIPGSTMAAGSLVATQMNGTPSVIGVTETYGVVSTTGSAAHVISGLTAVPGSLVTAGNTAVFGVNENGRLVKIVPSGASFVGSVETPAGLHGGSLVWHPSTSELFGTDPAGVVYRLFSSGTVSALQLPGIPKVVPGSLVDGKANGIFGVLQGPASDLVWIHLVSGSWVAQTITQFGGQVIPGSGFGDPVDGGRYYGINVAGQIIGTWSTPPIYSIIE